VGRKPGANNDLPQQTRGDTKNAVETSPRDLVENLRSIPLFAYLSDAALERILECATEFEVGKEHVLVPPNQPGRAVHHRGRDRRGRTARPHARAGTRRVLRRARAPGRGRAEIRPGQDAHAGALPRDQPGRLQQTAGRRPPDDSGPPQGAGPPARRLTLPAPAGFLVQSLPGCDNPNAAIRKGSGLSQVVGRRAPEDTLIPVMVSVSRQESRTDLMLTVPPAAFLTQQS
jgi:hypothetical protein